MNLFIPFYDLSVDFFYIDNCSIKIRKNWKKKVVKTKEKETSTIEELIRNKEF